jgi:uroporphyrin-III C-methyltransferase
MAESQDKQISKNIDSDKQQTKTTKNSSSSSSLFIVLIILLAAATGSGGFYLWQTQQSFLSKQSSIHSNLQQQLQNLKATVNNLNNKLTESNHVIDALNLQQTELTDLTQKALAKSNRSQKDWILAEIDYLLRLANRRLQISKDINSAIAALKAADKRIYDLGDLNLFPVRKQLKKDIAKLKSLHQIDVNGTALTIDQILVHLPSLPFKTINDEIKSKLDTPKNTVINNENTGFVDSVIDTVMQIGDIKIHDRSLEPVTNAAQQQQLEQLLRSHLIAARLSALRYDQSQFLYDIEQSQKILQQHYNLTDNRVSQMQKDMVEFSQLNLSPELPDINTSWSMLQDALAGKKLTRSKSKKAQKKVTQSPLSIKPVKKPEGAL